MRVLLDTHIVLELVRGTLERRNSAINQLLHADDTFSVVSVASIWETAIKARLGKLDPGMPLERIAGYVEALGFSLLAIVAGHATAAAEPAPDTNDPFDRLLLAQCQVENLRLVTLDRALLKHPLALSMGA